MKRYHKSINGLMEQCYTGEWVLYEDHEQIIEDHEQIIEDLKSDTVPYDIANHFFKLYAEYKSWSKILTGFLFASMLGNVIFGLLFYFQ